MDTVYAAQKLYAARVAEMDRQNEFRRIHLAPHDTQRPSGLAVVTEWFTRLRRPHATVAVAHAG